MLSLTELTTRCQHIGRELCEQDLSLYQLVDRATALTFLARALTELLEREYPVMGSAMGIDPVEQEIRTARTALRDAAIAAQAGDQEELRGRLRTAQHHLLVPCRLLVD